MAAVVNGEGISLIEWDAQVTEYIEAHEALGHPVAEDEAGTAVLEDMIAQMLLAQAARVDGFELTDEQLTDRINGLAEQVGGPADLATWQGEHGYNDSTFRVALKRAAEAAYMRDRIVSGVPTTAEQVHVQQILLYNEGDATRIENQLLGGANFDQMAAAVDPKTRGELSWFPRGYLLEPAIEEAAFAMEVGEISEVIPTGVGFHIIKVLERDEDHPLSPDAYLALQELALQEWVAAQRAAATVILAP
jgi:peptidyl-prolyl cis-trans isomerase C